LERILDRMRIITLPESRDWLGAPRPQLLATLGRLQHGLVEAGLLSAPVATDSLFRWPPPARGSSCRR
jgi:hypothetical protein